MGLPSILILFTQKAVTAVKRSQQGIVGIIIRDDTNANITTKVYKSYTEIQESDWTPENYRFLKDCFEFTPAKVKIFRIGTGVKGKMADALKLVANLHYTLLLLIHSNFGSYGINCSWNSFI